MDLIARVYVVIGWGWNSGQSSPTSSKDFKKLVVIRMAGAGAAAAAAGTGHVEDKVDSPTGKKRRHTSQFLLTDCPQPVRTSILHFLLTSVLSSHKKPHGPSLRANYSDRATAACRRSDCQLFADRGCHVVSVMDPSGRILGSLDRSRYFSIK
jgi:hypothetical protein